MTKHTKQKQDEEQLQFKRILDFCLGNFRTGVEDLPDEEVELGQNQKYYMSIVQLHSMSDEMKQFRPGLTVAAEDGKVKQILTRFKYDCFNNTKKYQNDLVADKEASGLQREFEDEFNRNCMDEHCFEGPVSITNWTMTRRQQIIHDLSFESEAFDIYDPKFSSEQASERSDQNKILITQFQLNTNSDSGSIITKSPTPTKRFELEL